MELNTELSNDDDADDADDADDDDDEAGEEDEAEAGEEDDVLLFALQRVRRPRPPAIMMTSRWCGNVVVVFDTEDRCRITDAPNPVRAMDKE